MELTPTVASRAEDNSSAHNESWTPWDAQQWWELWDEAPISKNVGTPNQWPSKDRLPEAWEDQRDVDWPIEGNNTLIPWSIDLPEAVAVLDTKKAEYQAKKLDTYLHNLVIDSPTAWWRWRRKTRKQQEVFDQKTQDLTHTIKGLFDKNTFDAALPEAKKEMMNSLLTQFDQATKTTIPELAWEKNRVREDIVSLLQVDDRVYTYEMSNAKQYTELDGKLIGYQQGVNTIEQNNAAIYRRIDAKHQEINTFIAEYAG